jgi:hypothetical protein
MNIKQIALIFTSITCIATNADPRKINNSTLLENLPTIKCLCNNRTRNGRNFESECNTLGKRTINDIALSITYDPIEQHNKKMQEWLTDLETLRALLSEKEQAEVGKQVISLGKTIQQSVDATITSEIKRLEDIQQEWKGVTFILSL